MMFRRFLPAAALLMLPAMAMAADQQPAAAPQTVAGAPNPTAPLAHTPRDPAPEQVEAHIKALHDELGITKKQEALWAPFAQDMRDNGQRLHDAIEDRRTKLPNLNAVENMQSYADLVIERAHDMQTLNAAFASLYDSFSKKQRKHADTLFREGDSEHAATQQSRAAEAQGANAPAAAPAQ